MERALHFNKTIKQWDEALPLGNGDLGCLIWNNSNMLRFSIDKGGIWDCSDSPENQNLFNYKNLKKLIDEKNQPEIERIFDRCYSWPTPTKLPAGKIILDLGVCENVVSHLDLLTAEATLSAGEVRVRSFIHACDNFGLIEITGQNVQYKIENPLFGTEKDEEKTEAGITQSLKNLIYDKAKFFEKDEDVISYKYFIQPTKDCMYGIACASKAENNKTLIAYTVGIGKNIDFINSCLEDIKAALTKGYDEAIKSHKAWWKDYFNKSSISIPDKEIEKQWYFNNYLLGSASRKSFYPMPLQGVWTADNGQLPPWKGDYHHDLNTQMTYTSYLKANHLEQGECFIDYLLNLSERGEDFCEKFYGVSGLCMPSVMDIKGYALGGWSQYALSPTNQLWLCQIMARYYFFHKDKNYLFKIYEYCSKVAKMLFNIIEYKDGKYYLPLSTSPEINDNKLSAWLTPNSNYDLALMQSFFYDMAKLSEEVGLKDRAVFWKKELKKLDHFSINENNILMISPDMELPESHRHHAHCMMIYPLKLLEYTDEQSIAIIDATIKDLEEKGIFHWVGYSVVWMAQLYIAQGNGDKALKELHNFFDFYVTDNGFHANGDFKDKTDMELKYRLFTLEGNFIAADAIQDMLFYSERGKIKLFPAIPKVWDNLEFNSFRGYDGILVSSRLEKGKLSYIRIEAENDCSVKILNDISNFKNIDKYIENGILKLKAGQIIELRTN